MPAETNAYFWTSNLILQTPDFLRPQAAFRELKYSSTIIVLRSCCLQVELENVGWQRGL